MYVLTQWTMLCDTFGEHGGNSYSSPVHWGLVTVYDLDLSSIL